MRIIAASLSVLVLAVTGYVWNQYRDLTAGIRTSSALGATAAPAAGADTNILVMGLDSRLDENGNALPADIYDALHAGDAANGGYNANVLMLLHIPGDGSKATSISIPRDDYVDFPDTPDGTAEGKIKQAYGLAFDQANRQLRAQGVTDPVTLEQRSRDAGRTAEIHTVREFLGGVPIDHFVEVTLMAFYQIAQVVQPITVCVNEDTTDSYSGADFHAGRQQITAAQAVAFVRQRRDNVHPELNFTDLDRERRQQAFISSLAYQLKQAGTLVDPTRLNAILKVADQNIAIDSGLDLLSFATNATSLSSGNISFTTLPITGFGTDPLGESINTVDLTQIRATVQNLLSPPVPATPAPAPSAGATVDVVDSTGQTGLAATMERDLAGQGYTAGTTTTGARTVHTTLSYAPDAADPARTLATLLAGPTPRPDGSLPAGHIRLVLGNGFTVPPKLAVSSSASSTPTTPEPATSDPASVPSALAGGEIPCVK